MVEPEPEPEPQPELDWQFIKDSMESQKQLRSQLPKEQTIYQLLRKIRAFPKEYPYKQGIHFRVLPGGRLMLSSEFWKLYYGDITP